MDNKHLYAVILAGGSGTRFWPLSRRKNPKQFLEIVGGRSLLELTLKRIAPSVNPKNIFIVTNKMYASKTKKELKAFGVPFQNIMLEPQGKNTAPAICWAASHIHRLDPNAVISVLPSDHLILNQDKFIKCLKQAVGLAQKGFLVTFGIVPTRAETGYGYLKTQKKKINSVSVLSVERFTEKPDAKTAKAFVKSKSYFWNSGMFVWTSEEILNQFEKLLPKIYSLVGKNLSYARVLSNWKKLPSISVDYGILEKADNVIAVAARNIGWSDLGSWESLIETLEGDNQGNLLMGDVHNLDCTNTLVYGSSRMIAAIGINDCIVVDTKDALLICRKDDSQRVKEVVEFLKAKKMQLL